MIIMGAAADPKLLKAAADAHHKAIGSVSGPNGVTSRADWDSVNAALGRVIASVPESMVMDVYNSVSAITSVTSCIWLFIGWALHYIPFWAMGRVLYFHHYFPAQLYASMLTAIIFDHVITSLSKILPNSLGTTIFHTLVGGYLSMLWYSFYYFSPLAYGLGDTPASLSNSTVHHLKWIDSWEF